MDKVKGFGEADAFPSDEAEARWIWPEFTRPFGFLADGQPTLSGDVGRWKGIGLATFRVDCLAIRETELVPFG